MQSIDINDDPAKEKDQRRDDTSQSIKLHDTKRFRLRAVSSEYEIYERYFKSGVAKKISLVQMGIALLILISQVLTMSMLLWPTLTEYWGTGIWCSVITAAAATMTLSAAKKSSYCKLHTSMALHLVNVLAHCFFEMCLLLGTIPSLRRRIYATQRDEISDIYKSNYNHYMADNFNRTDVPVTSYTSSSDASPELTANQISLGLAAFMTLGGLLQILLSFFMTIKSGRAICCGRAHLEGKFFEIETAGREDAGAVIQFGKTGKESDSRKTSSIPPPPYVSGYFPSSVSTSAA